MEDEVKRRTRGLGKKPRLFNTSIRIDQHVKQYFDTYHPHNKQAKMREVLSDYVNSCQLQLKELQDEAQEDYGF